MSLKREADPFIKPDPDAKRVKTEGADDNFSLSSIPMAPPPAAFASSTSSDIARKIESGDRKALGAAPKFGGPPIKSGKRRFFGNTIKARRDDDWVSAHFNKSSMVVEFQMNCALSKQWSSIDVEQEIFDRLIKAKFDIQPSEDWGFLDRKFRGFVTNLKTIFPVHTPTSRVDVQCTVGVVQNLNVSKVEVSPKFKKEEQPLERKSERLE
ncbi:hypothetical protein INS49_002489 [Diaporthe citri]|uniref:uncharacterized protein n=1 Tax=Diaporthe citri TaxID=83186 RepID=UPI001C8173DF|nr:uncharacterized protein INS49_002489 [Diaporthe citri]KAG6368284.1 hypothetical protein INS49_002489 [Diaporthe citri]